MSSKPDGRAYAPAVCPSRGVFEMPVCSHPPLEPPPGAPSILRVIRRSNTPNATTSWL
ncbi:hypothetical protein RSAG8_10925, partial [Rhizoctonia solani AG-8 WAC10335]